MANRRATIQQGIITPQHVPDATQRAINFWDCSNGLSIKDTNKGKTK